MGSLIQVVAIGVIVLVLAAVIFKPKRKKDDHPDVSRKALYDYLTFSQLREKLDRDTKSVTKIRSTMGLLFDVIDPTEVDGMIGRVSLPLIPRGTRSASMFDNRKIVICLSQDKRTILHQSQDADERYTLYFVSSVDRTLEMSYDILVERARNATTFQQRRIR